MHFWMHLLSWSVFARMIFFTLFTIYFLIPFPCYFWQQSWFCRYRPLSAKFNFFIIWMNSYFLSSILLYPPSLVQDKSVLNKEQERDTDLFCTKGDTVKLQNRTQEIAPTRISGNEINQKKVFLKVCTCQNYFIETRAYIVHQSIEH